MTDVTRADYCVIGVAECFRGDGEIMANPIGTVPAIGGRVAREVFEPDLVMTDGEALLIANGIEVGVDDPNAAHGRVGTPAKTVEAWNPYRTMFDVVWSGRRHVMMGASQLDPYGNQNFAFIGDPAQPKVQLLGMRGAPGNTVQNVTSYWIPAHSPRVFVEKVDIVSGLGYDRAAELGDWVREHHQLRRVVTNLGVLDFGGPDHRLRLVSVHPGVTVDDVVAATGFELAIADHVEETRPPSPEESEVIARLDPKGMRLKEVPA
jgi:acyl CoA:acetate/3-ketoacid CoA transferase beta subunit